jgi:hypothetical protein
VADLHSNLHRNHYGTQGLLRSYAISTYIIDAKGIAPKTVERAPKPGILGISPNARLHKCLMFKALHIDSGDMPTMPSLC